MKTPNLFDLPKTHPSRAEKLKAFKELNGIWTHHSKHMAKEDHPWSALLLSAARDLWDAPEKGPVELIAGYCRVFEEAGLLTTGRTEREAIDVLCARNGIPLTF